MQTTSSAMIDDLLKVISEYQSKFVGIYETLKDLTDAVGTPSPAMQAIVIEPSEFYYHVIGGKWAQFAPVGKVHPNYVGSYDNLPDLKVASPAPKDGDLAILGKSSFYVADGGSWVSVIIGAGKADNAKVVQNSADIATLKATSTKNTADIASNKSLAIKARTAALLVQAVIKKLDPHDVFQYRGATLPTLPDWPASGYFINVYAMQTDGTIKLPTLQKHGIRKGSIFFLSNEDKNNSIKVTSDEGTIGGATALNVPFGDFIFMSKTDNGWQVLLSGYIPPTLPLLISEIRSELGYGLHSKDDILTIINDWFANPTTQAKVNKLLNQLGYKRTGSGPAVLPSAVKVHIGVSNSYPLDFSGETGEYSPHEDMIISNLNLNPRKVWIAVPYSVKGNVSGIVANDGLQARWPNQMLTINGADWVVYLSPTRLADSTLKLDIKWSI